MPFSMCLLSLSVLSGGAGEDGRGPVDPLWMRPFLKMVVGAEPQLLGKGQVQSQNCIHSRPGQISLVPTCSCPFFRINKSCLRTTLCSPWVWVLPPTHPKIFPGVECGEPSTEDCSLPALHQGLRAPPTGIAAWTRPRRAQQTSSASSCVPSTWHGAWARQRPGAGREPRAACAPAAAVPCAASSPAGLRRSRMRCSSADVKAPRAPSAGARLSCPPARSRAPGRRRPLA